MNTDFGLVRSRVENPVESTWITDLQKFKIIHMHCLKLFVVICYGIPSKPVHSAPLSQEKLQNDGQVKPPGI